MSRGGDRDCKVYVGDLPSSVCRQDLEDAFNHYGYLRSVWVARNPPGFAFVEFDDSRDAKDAVRALDGSRICGKEVKVELSSGRSRRGGGGGRFGGGGGGYGRGPPRDRRNESCYACGGRGHFARDCRYGRKPGDGRNSRYRRSRSRSRSPRRRFSRSASRSRSPSPKD